MSNGLANRRGWSYLKDACAFALGAAACDNTARGVRDDATQNKQAVDEQAEKAKAQARETADEVKRASGQAGAAIDAALHPISGTRLDISSA